ncbi:BRCA1-associated RING domain protein 1 isoform X2 [Phyllopteryx taeniolatus]|uniref:BRCA1-associated RING domain protein 1 isoform X2 n=1 Tax=Phyllopteryx taeniolatus TaxID=161469 RepID=UPI002AD2E3F1|nr:BRCA1-associated RING domain protein 1 isoform X2 [Phyllopteryx taeniolatus]
MDTCAGAQTKDWKNTKEAVANFRRLLLCSKCSQLLKDPVCLGTCEHMLCRSCAGPQAGDGCVVCQSPSWVKDIQINRQLSSIIQLFCGLESMLNPDGLPDSSEVIRAQNEGTILKHKKNFKIWFSPRSRKVRCVVEKAPKVCRPETKSLEKAAEAQPDAPTAKVTDLMVFNFTSSSQDSGSSSPTSSNNNQNRKRRTNVKKIGSRKKTMKRATKKQRRQMVKRKLDAVNKQWRITEVESTSVESEHLAAEVESRFKKRVSFLSPDVLSDIQDLGSVSGNCSEGSIAAPVNPALLCQNESDSFHHDTLPTSDSIPKRNAKKQATLSSPQHSSKHPRLDGEAVTLETTPKRPTASPSCCRKSLGHSSPAALNSLSLPSLRCKKTTHGYGGESPPVPSIVGQKSTSPRASLGRCNSRNPAVVKKNHKGETSLHLAAIKGDLKDVKKLLDQGADPNLKDNAGWTPLHEACNLGHLVVVEALLSRGAFLNTPGYENDSPLHDAVRNGHIAIVKLLLQFGASQSVVNLHGKRPADYAVSQEMLEVFQEVPEEAQNANTSITSPASLSLVGNCAKQEEIVLFLSSKLSQTDQHQFAKLSRLLDGRITDSFTYSVSHIVVPEGPLLSTYSTLLGLLAGCWIVKYSYDARKAVLPASSSMFIFTEFFVQLHSYCTDIVFFFKPSFTVMFFS